tara:strand:+ start:2011 stop:2157 length:147 start_codon:yes stop_codon:yes gene_type:complete
LEFTACIEVKPTLATIKECFEKGNVQSQKWFVDEAFGSNPWTIFGFMA